jgi:hypothetical protein
MWSSIVVEGLLILYFADDYWQPSPCDCVFFPCSHRAPRIEEESRFQGEPEWVGFPSDYDLP